jgi:hypothetical protein
MKGGWNIADCVERSYDVEGMHVGTVAAGRIGLVVLRRLKPFDMHPHYFDRHRRDHFRGLLDNGDDPLRAGGRPVERRPRRDPARLLLSYQNKRGPVRV